jgi:hypothetical protein
VAATHRPGYRAFSARYASPELEAIAEDGNAGPMAALLGAASAVTDAVEMEVPVTRPGTTVGNFMDQVTFRIQAKPGDRLSFAAMLICTNDGFTALHGAKLPEHGARQYWTRAYDAGTENNTERSVDVVDACSALGPYALAGDPNGNEDGAVDTQPREPVRQHPGITGAGDLDPADHGWPYSVTQVTVRRIY